MDKNTSNLKFAILWPWFIICRVTFWEKKITGVYMRMNCLSIYSYVLLVINVHENIHQGYKFNENIPPGDEFLTRRASFYFVDKLHLKIKGRVILFRTFIAMLKTKVFEFLCKNYMKKLHYSDGIFFFILQWIWKKQPIGIVK